MQLTSSSATVTGVGTSLVGNEAQSRGYIQLDKPIKQGTIADWNGVEKIWDYALYEKLGLARENIEHPILLTEPALNPKSHREKMVQVFFETFKASKVNISRQAVLSLYASGLTTGLIVDCGDGATQIVPVFDGYAQIHVPESSPLAGNKLTDHLMKLLCASGHNLTISDARNIKERFCYVASALEEEMQKSGKGQYYTLPDGQYVKIGKECYRGPEALFSPNMADMEALGLHHLAWKAIKKSEIKDRKEMGKSEWMQPRPEDWEQLQAYTVNDPWISVRETLCSNIVMVWPMLHLRTTMTDIPPGRRYLYASRNCGAYAQRNAQSRSSQRDNRGQRPRQTAILCLVWWFNCGVSFIV